MLDYNILHFFFSSRRRHTRWPRDWSSDVCSSDLNPTFENFVTALQLGSLDRAFLNSIVVALISVATNCVITVAAGYAFARLKFRGSDIVFYVLLATAAIPVAVTLIPLFLMVSNFPLAGGNDLFGRGGSGLIDTLGGIAIPYLVGTMSIFLVRQFYKGMSSELAAAARIDGGSEYRIFWKIGRAHV